jgi:hypothetical protein
MALIGNLIKSAVEISSRFSSGLSPKEDQIQTLEELLKTAAATAFGTYHNFAGILDAKNIRQAFRKEVPIVDYHQLYDQWWNQQQKNPNITWPGKPGFFALSSGTTGQEPKRIPVTQAMLDSIRTVSMAQIKSLSNYDLPPDFFEKEILALGSSSNLTKYQQHFEGEISGINASQAPGWFEFFYRPGREIAAISDWDERVAAIAEKAPEWDIGAIAGIPSWVLQMLQRIVETHKLDTIHDLWPDLHLYASGGVALEPFRESFDALMAKPIHYQDTYLASEGYFAYTARPDTMGMEMALQHGIYYEFIPFDEQGFDGQGELLDDPVVVPIEAVEADKDYALLISTCAGAWRYLIGDTVRFTDIDRMEIVISGRTKYFLNVVGSQLSEEKMNSGIAHLGEELGVAINEYAVAALEDTDGNHYHQWVVGTEEGAIDNERGVAILDDFLRKANKNYGVAREKALSGVRLRQVPVRMIYDFMEAQKKKGGQVKVPKVMKPEEMRDLLNFTELKG